MSIPWESLLGGMLLGLSATILLLVNGKIAGISGIINGWLEQNGSERLWRQWFIIGVIGGGALFVLFYGLPVTDFSAFPTWSLIVGGLLVGLGTRVGNGCTSGHGICGIGRLSKRSIVATMVFMTVAIVTVFVRLHLV